MWGFTEARGTTHISDTVVLEENCQAGTDRAQTSRDKQRNPLCAVNGFALLTSEFVVLGGVQKHAVNLSYGSTT